MKRIVYIIIGIGLLANCKNKPNTDGFEGVLSVNLSDPQLLRKT